MVYIVNDGLEVIACRSGNNNVLSTCIDVCHSLVLGCVETCALQNYIDVKILPGKVCRVLLSVDSDFLAINDDGVLGSFYLSIITAMCCIILQKICEHIRRCKIVDRNNVIAFSLEHLSESKTTDTAKSINCYSYCHVIFLLKRKFRLVSDGAFSAAM